MIIKKAALSLFVIGASGAYVWSQSVTSSGSDLSTASLAAEPARPTAAVAVTVEPPLIVREPANGGDIAAAAAPSSAVKVQSLAVVADAASPDSAANGGSDGTLASADGPAPSPAPPSPATMPVPRLRPVVDLTARTVKVSAKVAAKSGHRLHDGTFDGPAVDAFYGLVQIEAVVQNGTLLSVKVLQYPSDRRTSVAINRQALPSLKLEAVAAQSADIDIVSGATLTSEAFIESLGAALRQAMA
jgi:uncharacterized protein with FMN-binding domain